MASFTGPHFAYARQQLPNAIPVPPTPTVQQQMLPSAFNDYNSDDAFNVEDGASSSALDRYRDWRNSHPEESRNADVGTFVAISALMFVLVVLLMPNGTLRSKCHQIGAVPKLFNVSFNTKDAFSIKLVLFQGGTSGHILTLSETSSLKEITNESKLLNSVRVYASGGGVPTVYIVERGRSTRFTFSSIVFTTLDSTNVFTLNIHFSNGFVVAELAPNDGRSRLTQSFPASLERKFAFKSLVVGGRSGVKIDEISLHSSVSTQNLSKCLKHT